MGQSTNLQIVSTIERGVLNNYDCKAESERQESENSITRHFEEKAGEKSKEGTCHRRPGENIETKDLEHQHLIPRSGRTRGRNLNIQVLPALSLHQDHLSLSLSPRMRSHRRKVVIPQQNRQLFLQRLVQLVDVRLLKE